MNSTATSALEVLLEITPLDIYIKQTAKVTLMRLLQAGTLNRRLIGHSNLINNLDLNTQTDYIVPYNNIDLNIKLVIPSIDDWLLNKVDLENIQVFTDGSKSAHGTGSGFHCSELGLSGVYRLGDDCSVFQAEIHAIKKAAEQISMLPIYGCDIGFYIDSQATLKALTSSVIRSKLVMGCLRELKVLCEQHSIKLCWVPGHKGIQGNERADELAKGGAILPVELAEQDVYPTLSVAVQNIRSSSKEEWHRRWFKSNHCEQTKLLWNETLSRNSKILLEMDRRQLRMVVNLTTGHNTLGKHMVTIGMSDDDTCRWCMDAIEDSFHLLCECPALAYRRFIVFNSYFFQTLCDVRGVNPWKLWTFIQLTKWKA